MERRYWTCTERRRAIELRDQGLKYVAIAAEVGRSPDAVAAHLRALRLSEDTSNLIDNSPERNGPRSEVSEARPDQHERSI